MTFDPDFASAAEWARLYRAKGVQVVPCTGKIPFLKSWKEYQNELVPEATFERWYGAEGLYSTSPNMGMLTGTASGHVLMIDLDIYKPGGAAATMWWSGILALHNNNMGLETWEQLTGGGGRQMFFRYPAGWRSAVNAKTDLHIDTRGQGGFAVLPPSLHASGRHYEWREGRGPWQIELLEAPVWLLEEIEKLVREHGGGSSAVMEKTSAKVIEFSPYGNSPGGGGQMDAFGHQTDLREDKMFRLIWGAVVDWYRECPIKPSDQESMIRMAQKYLIYQDQVASRLHDPMQTKMDLLDQEGRGPAMFHVKWLRAMDQWEGRVRDEANVAPPKRQSPSVLIETPLQLEQNEFEVIPPISGSLLLTAEQFVAGFTPPAYLIDGILQRGYLYSLTARTGHGKTAVAMYIAQCIARGEAMHGCAVKQGTVLLLAGENPDDIRARFLILAEAYGFRPESLKMRFVAGVVNLTTSMPQIRAEASMIEDLVLVIVDTAAAYFPGDETNSNSQQGAYARTLRELTFLPGLPAVLVNCHPIKNASRDNLIPMGGSAFLNEVDGNLTLWATAEKQMYLHWLGKFRGPEFNPLAFEITVETSDRVKDAEGRMMPNAVAKPISDAVLERAEELQTSDEDRLLRLIWNRKRSSFAEYALELGLKKIQVQRIADRLKGDKLAEIFRGRLRLTPKGEKELGVGKRKNDDDWG